jgi:hypothetical protein
MISYHISVPFFVLGHPADLVVEDFAAPMSSVAVPLFTRAPTIAVVQWLFARETSRKYKFPFFLAEELGVRSHRHFVAVSQHMAAEIQRRNPRAHVDAVYAGVSEMLRSPSPCSPPAHEILYLGRLQIVEKGLDLLLDAFGRLAAVDGVVRLLVAGDGYQADQLNELVGRLGLAARVEVLGRVEGTEKRDLLRRASLVVLPSRFESFGMAAAEALASGTPVVAFALPSLEEIVSPDCGILVEPYDTEALALACASILADPDRRARAARFDWDLAASAQEAAYLAAVRTSSSRRAGWSRERTTTARDWSPPCSDGDVLVGDASEPSTDELEDGPDGDVLVGDASEASTDELEDGPDASHHTIAPPDGDEQKSVLRGGASRGSFSDERLRGRLAPWLRTALAPCLGVIGLSAVLRIAFPNAYDLFGDEVYYTDISTSVRQGHYPPHYAKEGVFLLHPPFFFLLGGLWQAIVRPGGDYFQLVDSMRLLVALFALATAALLFGVGYRIAGWQYGLAAGALFAVEPFALRMNGRVLLETTALTFVLAGYFVLLGIMPNRRATSNRGIVRQNAHVGSRACCAGLLMGLGTVTLELAAIITIGPLLVLFWRKWGVERRFALLALIGAVVPYGAYLVSLAITHHVRDWVNQDLIGLQRLLGIVPSKGTFNGPASPSLLHDILAKAPIFATTYLLVALGVLTAVYLLFQHGDGHKLLGTVVLFGAVAVLYEVTIGADEEQFLYVLLIPVLAALAIVSSSLIERSGRSRRRARTLSVLLGAGCLVIVLYDLGVASYVRSRPDNGVARVVSFFKNDARDRGVIATNSLVATAALRHSDIRSLTLTTSRAAARAHVRYLVVLSAELPGSYGPIDVQQARWYAARGRIVFSFDEATYGKVLVYETTNPSAW